MHRKAAIMFVALGLIAASRMSAQSAQAPQTPEDALTARPLIAWSNLQAPQPAPEPLPARDNRVPRPEQPQQEQPKVPGHASEHEPAIVLTGRLIQTSDGYSLKATAADKPQRLVPHPALNAYENHNVRIIGIEAADNTIRVSHIESLP